MVRAARGRAGTLSRQAQYEQLHDCEPKWKAHPQPSSKLHTLNTFLKESNEIWRLIGAKCVRNWRANHTQEFAPENPMRMLAFAIVTWPPFDACIGVCILLNCLLLAAHDPLDEGHGGLRNTILYWGDTIIVAIFVTELVLKIFAFGLYRKSHSFFRSKYILLYIPYHCYTYIIIIIVRVSSQLTDIHRSIHFLSLGYVLDV